MDLRHFRFWVWWTWTLLFLRHDLPDLSIAWIWMLKIKLLRSIGSRQEGIKQLEEEFATVNSKLMELRSLELDESKPGANLIELLDEAETMHLVSHEHFLMQLHTSSSLSGCSGMCWSEDMIECSSASPLLPGNHLLELRIWERLYAKTMEKLENSNGNLLKVVSCVWLCDWGSHKHTSQTVTTLLFSLPTGVYWKITSLSWSIWN